jgi:hypothetical protein
MLIVVYIVADFFLTPLGASKLEGVLLRLRKGFASQR